MIQKKVSEGDREHTKIKDYKKINRKVEQNLNTRNDRLVAS